MMTTTDVTIGVIRPGPDGRWWAAHGLGSMTCEIGWLPTRDAAYAAASADDRTVTECRRGESGWMAYAREQRTAAAGHEVPWMSLGHVNIIDLPEDLATLDTTLALAAEDWQPRPGTMLPGLTDDPDLTVRVETAPGRWQLTLRSRGLAAWDARGRPAVPRDDLDREVLTALIREAEPAAARRIIACGTGHLRDQSCPWCFGVAWEGDLEPPPVPRGTVAVESGPSRDTAAQKRARRNRHARERDPDLARRAVDAELLAWDEKAWLIGDGAPFSAIADAITARWLHRAAMAGYPGGLRGYVAEELRRGAEPVGLAEIATRLAVERDTADHWRRRGVLPRPTWPEVGGRPAWAWIVIEAWALTTGRLPVREPRGNG